MKLLLRIYLLALSLLIGGAQSYGLAQAGQGQDSQEVSGNAKSSFQNENHSIGAHFQKPEKAEPSFSFPVLDEEEDTEDFHDNDAGAAVQEPWLGASQFSPHSAASNPTVQGIFPDVRQYPASCRRYIFQCVFRV